MSGIFVLCFLVLVPNTRGRLRAVSQTVIMLEITLQFQITKHYFFSVLTDKWNEG